MAITIGRYAFDGPHRDTAFLGDRAGVYAVLDQQLTGQFVVIDIGESESIRTRVETHDRRPCWRRQVKGVCHVAVHYTPQLQQAGRRVIEQELRRQFSPRCGEQ